MTLTGEKSYWGNSHNVFIKSFYEAIQSQNEPYISPRDAAKTIEIITKFYQYANLNQEIKMNNGEESS